MMLKSMVSRILRYLKYVFRYLLAKKPRILSREETVEAIKEFRLSIARYGDGELKMMSSAKDIHFQDASNALIGDLRRCFETRNERLLVCISESLRLRGKNYKKRVVRFYRWQLGLFYRDYSTLLDYSYRYGNANITRFYMDYKNPGQDKISSYINVLRELWADRNVLIVEGSNTKLGAMTDLLDNASSIRRILCPDQNAYPYMSEIQEKICENYTNDDLVLLCLGPTASVLATDLCINYGFQCLDLGHIDVEYIWFLNNLDEKTPIEGMNSAEASLTQKTVVMPFDELKYQTQIVDFVKVDEPVKAVRPIND